MNKLALHFGAGNIGRGFIAPVLIENNYDVIFVDVDKSLINKIKKEKHFDIKLIESKNLYKSVENIDGINLSDEEELNKALNQCSLVTTSVGPNHVGEVLKIVINNAKNRELNFIAFENQYRSSTTSKIKCDYKENNIKFTDVVVDKIIPKQESNELDIFVEEYGMILIDENHEKIFKESEIVRYGDYEYEFRKKLWMLNGYHLCLSYFGLANNLKYVHELFINKKTKDFTEKMGKEFLDSVFLLKNEDRVQLERFMDTIHKRFSNSMINDELRRVARNPLIKFAKNERFHGPLDLLIDNDKSIESFKQILDILYEYDFSFVEGYKEFKDKIIYLSVKNFPADDSTATNLSPFTITSSTTKVDTRARGRYANIKIENTGAGESWRFGTFQVDLQPDGRRG